MNPIQVIAVTGGKGGVGKTNVAVNLGVAMGRLGRRVMLLDADLGLANVDVLLGLKPRHTLKDVLEGTVTLPEIVLQGPGGLGIVPAASGLRSMASLGAQEHAGLINAFSELGNRMDVLLIDTAAGIDDGVVNFLCAAHEILLVVCNEPTSITDAYAVTKILNLDYGVARVRVVANMVRNAAEGEAMFNKLRNVTDRFLDIALHYAGTIPQDDHLRRAVRRQKAVIDVYPDAPSSKAFVDLASVADGWPIPAIAGGHLEFFVDRLVQEQRAV